MNRVHFSSLHDEWKTPQSIYAKLNEEFKFNDDPCPLGGKDGLERAWGSSTFVNPPYSTIAVWVAKAWKEHLGGACVVMLIPSRTDTRWWHDYVMRAKEIRFIKGRLKFGGAKWSAPFPSAVIVFKDHGSIGGGTTCL